MEQPTGTAHLAFIMSAATGIALQRVVPELGTEAYMHRIFSLDAASSRAEKSSPNDCYRRRLAVLSWRRLRR